MRRLRYLLCGLLLLVLGIGALASWRAVQARGDLAAAAAMAPDVKRDLRAGDLDGAREALPTLRRRLDRASTRVHGQSFAVALHFPVLGRNLDAVRRAADSARLLRLHALPPLEAALDLAQDSRPIGKGAVDLAVLHRISGHLQAAATASGRAGDELTRRPQPILGRLEGQLQEADDKVAALGVALQEATRAVDVTATMLGRDGTRRYFVAVQNNAEARATGGLVGAFAVVRADRGTVTLERTGTNAELTSTATPVASDPRAAKTWQDIGSTRAWFDANLTPHFPDAARNMAGLWQAQTGQRLDGVVALDPIVMSQLLKVGGALRLADGSKIDAQNVVDFVMRREYVDYPDNAVRKPLLRDLAAQVFHQVVAAKDPGATAGALFKASRTGHLFLWSRRPAEQEVLARGIVGGALPAKDVPYLQLITQNFGGNKLDYYLRRTVTVRRQTDGRLRVDLVLRNQAPLGLPRYMTVRSDRPKPPVPYGQASVGLAFYGALSSRVTALSVDGLPSPFQADRDHGHLLGTLTLELPRDRDVRVTLVLSEPPGTLTYRQQPLVRPDLLRIHLPHRIIGRSGSLLPRPPAAPRH